MAARELTEKEKKRQVLVEKTIKEKEAEGYNRVDLTTPTQKANIMAFLLGTPICIPFLIIHHMLYGYHLPKHATILFAAGLVALVVVHELIHGAVWGSFAKKHFKSIEFGFIVKSCMPYCTCLEPLTKVQYILGSVMPGVILGLIPSVVSLINGSYMTLMFGCAMMLGAGGDLTVLLNLLKYKTTKKELMCLDHPTEVGLIILEK